MKKNTQNISDEQLKKLEETFGEHIEHIEHSVYQMGLEKTIIKRMTKPERYRNNERFLEDADRVIIIITNEEICFSIDAETYRNLPYNLIKNGTVYHSIQKKGDKWLHTKNVDFTPYLVSL